MGVSVLLYLMLALCKVERQIEIDKRHPSHLRKPLSKEIIEKEGVVGVDGGALEGEWHGGRRLLSKEYDESTEGHSSMYKGSTGLRDGFEQVGKDVIGGDDSEEARFDVGRRLLGDRRVDLKGKRKEVVYGAMPNRDGKNRFVSTRFDDRMIENLPPPDFDDIDGGDDDEEEEVEREVDMEKKIRAVKGVAKNLEKKFVRKGKNVKDKVKKTSVKKEEDALAKTSVKKQKKTAKLKGLEDIDKISKFVRKTIKKLKSKTIIDCPCSAHLSWTPSLVRRLKKEVKGLQYHCIDKDQESLKKAKASFRNIFPKMKYSQMKLDQPKIPKNVDLAISWGGLDHEDESTQYRYIQGLYKSGARHIILGHYPEVEAKDGTEYERWEKYSKRMGLKRVDFMMEPFLLGKPDQRLGGIVKRGTPPKEIAVFSNKKLKSSTDKE